MDEAVRELISEKLAEKKLTMKAASLQIGRPHSFLFKFLKQNTPKKLNEDDRAKLAALLEIPEEQLRDPSSRPLAKRNYSKNAQSRDVVLAPSQPNEYEDDKQDKHKIISGHDLFGSAPDFPVFGTLPSAHQGAYMRTSNPVDWIVRPAILFRVQDGYGFIVPDDTMAPKHEASSIALVNPHLPPRVGQICILRCREENETHYLIREFRGETETAWRVRQLNPPKDSTLKKSDWQMAGKTVGSYFP